ncbi:unnamed protein product [Amoebophrya sp. A25]|nr:unnamed protein product [Amoebophrya sp. A25]|eukprot:GSA25T00014651001.1
MSCHDHHDCDHHHGTVAEDDDGSTWEIAKGKRKTFPATKTAYAHILATSKAQKATHVSPEAEILHPDATGTTGSSTRSSTSSSSSATTPTPAELQSIVMRDILAKKESFTSTSGETTGAAAVKEILRGLGRELSSSSSSSSFEIEDASDEQHEQHEQNNKVDHDVYDTFVALGLGSFTQNRNAQTQMALLLCLMDELLLGTSPLLRTTTSRTLLIYDPVMTEVDIAVAQEFGFVFSENAEACCGAADRTASTRTSTTLSQEQSTNLSQTTYTKRNKNNKTFFYMPTCIWPVYERVLASGMADVLLGNDILGWASGASSQASLADIASRPIRRHNRIQSLCECSARNKNILGQAFGYSLAIHVFEDRKAVEKVGHGHLLTEQENHLYAALFDAGKCTDVRQGQNKESRSFRYIAFPHSVASIFFPSTTSSTSTSSSISTSSTATPTSGRNLQHVGGIPSSTESINSAVLIGSRVWVDLKSMQIDGRATVVGLHDRSSSSSSSSTTTTRSCLKLKFDRYDDGREGPKRILETLSHSTGDIEKRIKGLLLRHQANGSNFPVPAVHPTVPVYLVHDTVNFRQCCAMQVRPGYDRVLEVGCSTGLLTEVLVKQRPKYLCAVDCSLDMVLKTRERIVGRGKECWKHKEMLQEKKNNDHISRPEDVEVEEDTTALGPLEEKRVSIQVADIFLQQELHQDETFLTGEDFTMATLDIGGDRDADQVESALFTLMARFPRLEVIVVKCEKLCQREGFEEAKLKTNKVEKVHRRGQMKAKPSRGDQNKRAREQSTRSTASTSSNVVLGAVLAGDGVYSEQDHDHARKSPELVAGSSALLISHVQLKKKRRRQRKLLATDSTTTTT